MSKFDIRNLQPNWCSVSKRPPWNHVSSRELSEILACSHQSISNWKMRGFLPAPDRHRRLKKNKNYFRISALRSLIEGVTEDDVILAWGREHISPDIDSAEQVRCIVNVAWRAFGFERGL